MKSIILHDKNNLEPFLRQNTPLYIYHIGDLDKFYWHNTIWFGLTDEEKLKSVILLYTAVNPPVLLALADEKNIPVLKSHIEAVLPLLPTRFYSHLTPGTEKAFENNYNLSSHGEYQKMVLADKSKINHLERAEIIRLGPDDIGEITQLYTESYPENSFDPRMLETGMYFGMKINSKLISISGVHVYSEKNKVAALGNITTHPSFRGKGIGQKVTAYLCAALLEKVDIIGLNVSINNIPAIKCYTNLGFVKCAPYKEYMIERKK